MSEKYFKMEEKCSFMSNLSLHGKIQYSTHKEIYTQFQYIWSTTTLDIVLLIS